MAVHDGMNIGPRLVDLAVDESLEETRAAVGVAGIAVQVVLDDVIGRYQGGGDRARHQVTLGRLGMAHRDVVEGVADALGDEDAARRGEVRDLLGGDRAARCGCVAAHVFSAPSFKRSLGSSCPNMAFLRECAIAMIAEWPERAGPRFADFPGSRGRLSSRGADRQFSLVVWRSDRRSPWRMCAESAEAESPAPNRFSPAPGEGGRSTRPPRD